MLYEYAVEPTLLNNWKDFRYFTEKLGVSRGRLISRYPKRWKKFVYESLTNCGEVERARIEERLRQLDDRLLPRQGQWDDNQGWLTNAEAEHYRRPFHAILAKINPRELDFIIVQYNECDALTTYLVWLRMAYFGGFFTEEAYHEEQEHVRVLISEKAQSPQSEHLIAYQEEWDRLRACVRV
ncbi:MAG: hypothetical protein ACRD5H_18590 [Nitrososphaerales archaeon]